MKMAPYQGRETCFKCLKEEKEQAQPQLYGTQYFSVRIALTGLSDMYDYFVKMQRKEEVIHAKGYQTIAAPGV